MEYDEECKATVAFKFDRCWHIVAHVYPFGSTDYDVRKMVSVQLSNDNKDQNGPREIRLRTQADGVGRGVHHWEDHERHVKRS